MFSLGRSLGRNARNVRVCNVISSNRGKASQAEPVEQIELPNRIPRSPTDILKALASTVSRDPTAAHFKYHDDPYLIPSSNMAKRTYAMSQEAGRKAARWIRQEHRELFQHTEAQPPVEAFAPNMVFTEETEVNADCLRDLIKRSQLADAVFVFNLMQTKGFQLSKELKQSLLELLCFYNHEDPLPEEYIEERWFRQGTSGKDRQRKTWKDGELAELLFAEIEPKTPQAYAALIRGMCKYFQVERAWALFQEATEKQHEVDTTTFNHLLSVSHFLKESGEMRWDLIQDLLTQMKDRKLQPDLGTLNAALSGVSGVMNNRLAKTACLKLLSEFKSLGIEPSLGSWYYVLIIFCRERGPVSHVLVDILHEIQGKQFEIMDPKDTFFFVTAMDVCRHHLHDKNLAKRVNELLHVGNNYDLIGDSYKESIYYRHYFALLCQTEPIEVFMETYDLLVPNVYIPEPGIMEEILKAVDVNGALDLMPRLWSDIVIFDHINRESLLNAVLKIISENKPNLDIPTHAELGKGFATISWDIFTKIDEQAADRVQRLSFTGQMLGEILMALCRAGEFDKAKKVFAKIDKNQHQIPGLPSPIALGEYIDLCISERSPTLAVSCLQYAADNSLQAEQLARKINSGFTLNESFLNKLKSLVGEECLKS